MYITKIKLIEVINSRGLPTTQVTMYHDDISASASSPSGASKGTLEAIEKHDENNHYSGKSIRSLCKRYNSMFEESLLYIEFNNQVEFDNYILKFNLGSNFTTALSFCFAKLFSLSHSIELYRYIGGQLGSNRIPIPMANVLNGGSHASNNISIQEFMIIPNNQYYFYNSTEVISRCFNKIKERAIDLKYHTGVGDEGGIAPNLDSTEHALQLILDACKGEDISIALDCAANEYYMKNGVYLFDSKELNRSQMIDKMVDLCNRYPIISIEDPFNESDFQSWKDLYKQIGSKVQIVGDDITVTNSEQIIKNHEMLNAVIIKPNQIGSLSGALDAIKTCNELGLNTVVSHRSGDTEDTYISDLAVGVNSKYIKIGNVCRSERTAKYNRVITIESDILN